MGRLHTDGFRLSDTRDVLRRHFEVNAAHIVVAALYGLAQRGAVKLDAVAEALVRYGIEPAGPDPRSG